MYLPTALPDELLLSRLIRHVTISGDNVGEFIGRTLGASRISVHPFLTARLEHLARVVGENAEVLFNEQTLGPLFSFYLPTHAEYLKRYMFASEGARAVRESQLPSFGCGHSVCLKWCPKCAEQDLQEYGVSYWRRSHQLPGVTACFEHPVLLQRFELQRRQRIIIGLLPTLTCSPQIASSIEFKVAKFGHNLIQQLRYGNPQLDISAIYRLRLAELGYITTDGRVRRKSLMQQFALEAAQYRPCPDSPTPIGAQDYRYVSQLLEPIFSHHPFRHILFASWLFREFRELLEYQSSPKIADIQAVLVPTDERQNIERLCLTLLRDNCSMAEVYRRTGKSRCYLKRLASLHGIPLKLKPKLLTQEFKRSIIQLAHAGMHRKSIAEQCGMSIGTVEQVISSQPNLVEWRKQCHWESKRRRSLVQIARFRQQNQKATRQDIKAQCTGAYFWLFSNDRNRLEKILPKCLIPVGRKR